MFIKQVGFFMFQDFKESLARWNNTTTERQKLQHTYLIIIVATIVIAGMVSLVSAKQGHQLARVALIAIGTFITNAVVWNLLNSAVLSKLPSRPKKK